MEKPGKQAASNLGNGGDEMNMFEFGGTGRQGKGRKAKGGGNVFSSGIGGFGGGGSKADGGDGKGISKQIMEGVNQVEPVSSQVACECNHGLMVEAIKKFMFSNR